MTNKRGCIKANESIYSDSKQIPEQFPTTISERERLDALDDEYVRVSIRTAVSNFPWDSDIRFKEERTGKKLTNYQKLQLEHIRKKYRERGTQIKNANR
ncbi:MAG TPA: hypothetical protein VF884_10230 [Nitrososphaeraceae archaeon]